VRVLALSQYFIPEVMPTAARVHALASTLAERGHDVEVISEVPNHPQGVVHEGYRHKLVTHRQLDRFRATYVWVHTRPVKTTRTRLAFYGSYALLSAIVGAARRRPDVVFAVSPPLPVAAAAATVAARHRVPWVMDVLDLWPEAPAAMGELSNPLMLRLAERLESRLYRSAAAITPVTESFREAIAAKVSDPHKVTVVPIGTSRLWLDGADLDVDRNDLGLPADRFVWCFAGNVGKAQGLEAAVDAAALLDDRFHLVILGNGPARDALERRAANGPPGAIEFRDQVPPDQARRYLRASDALLVPLAPGPAFESWVPSKLFDFCAVGRPVVLAARGESERLVRESAAALAVPPGEPQPLARAIRELERDARLRETIAYSGKRFAVAHRSERQIKRLAHLLEGVADSRLPRSNGHSRNSPS
jgi:glycosyltransferase involved in cell wall biosynthesis